MKDTTTTIDEILERVVNTAHPDPYNPTKPLTIDQAKQALLQWVLEVIGEYEVLDGESIRTWHKEELESFELRNRRDQLRAEQRAKLDQTLKAIEALGLTSKETEE